jgi:glycosyltransferase involved in cell wall biosynthesis
MKSPDDPVPSGDRTMARQLVRALSMAGHDVALLSEFKCRLKCEDLLPVLRHDSAIEVERIAQAWQREGPPDLVVTYHVYYKSPDLIGAALAKRFDLPYITIEASYAGKRDLDEWRDAQSLAGAAIKQAALNICFTDRDAQGVGKLVRSTHIGMLAPFADLSGFPENLARGANGPIVELVAVAMMLEGNKLKSFKLLSESLGRLSQTNWRLTAIGDGPARDEVEVMFEAHEQVRFAGQMDRETVAGYLARSDVFVWPGYREAFGLAYLEAQAMGVPVVAMRSGGVDAVVLDGETGVLVQEGDVTAFARAVDGLISDEARRKQMGVSGREFVRNERSIEQASSKLGAMLRQVVDQ